MIRVLFVDDEASLLSGLRRMLYSMRGHWEMHFANGGAEALGVLRSQSIDVLVTDMRMPEMDGAQLLAQVRAEFPEVVRIILSGYSELASMLRGLPVAHRFLSKPTSREDLIASIDRSRELQNRLHDPELRRTVGSITALPSPSTTIAELHRLLAMQHPPTAEIAAVLQSDIGMTAKLLQLANSAFFGISRAVTDVQQAVNFLGLSTIRDLVVAAEIFEGIEIGDEQRLAVVARVKEHSIGVGKLAGELMTSEQDRNEAFASGLLHDVGELIAAVFLADRYAELQRRIEPNNYDENLEREVLGATHASIGAYLLELWGLPYSIVEAVARHHDAEALVDRKFDAVHAVFIAEALSAIESGRRVDKIDGEYLRQLGVEDRVAVMEARISSVY